MMSVQRELSLNHENSLSNIKDLNETHLSQRTKGSGEKDFKELDSLINRTVREDKGNVSILSNSKIIDKSNSMLSNEDIWNSNKSPDDSRNFVKSFREIYEKENLKKKGNKILMSKKPKHLSIHILNQKQSNYKEEDYNDDIEESIEIKKTEQIHNMILATKNNNLNELSMANENSCSNNKTLFYTNPEDIYSYRTSYSHSNFSFTPQNQLNINEHYNSNPTNCYTFPTIPDNHAGIQISVEDNLLSFEERESNISVKESKNLLGGNGKSNYIIRKINSTRHSTESGESVPESNLNNNIYSNRKYYTPTHQNTNLSHEFYYMQRELNFNNQTSLNSNKFNNPQNITQSKVVKSNNNSQNLFQPNHINSNSIASNNHLIFSPTSLQNSNMNNIKSLSFCANNYKSPTVVKYGSMDFKPQQFIPGVFSPDKNIAKKVEEHVVDFKITLEDIIIGKDKRTTLMLRNIPNKYSLQNIIEEIHPSFIGKYDYINLPIDYERKLNLGYAFVNFIDPMHIIMFYETYHNKKWSKYRSDKKIDLNYAEKQGKKDISCKDENTYFAQEDKKLNFKKINPKLEISMKFYTFFKKIYPNSVCIVENKNGITGDKIFYVKSLGKR